jgi:hypothetical protein
VFDTYNIFVLELEYGPLAGVTDERFTLCLAIHFWNLKLRQVELRNRKTGNTHFFFNSAPQQVSLATFGLQALAWCTW